MTDAERVVAPDHSATGLIDLLSLAGRAAVVTGGGRGIGAATVRRLAEAGATVIAADLDVPRRRDGRPPTVAAATGRRVLAAAVDVADSAVAGRASPTAASSELGRLDVWVNNAGIFPTTGPAIDATRRASSTACCRSTCGARSPERGRRPGG